MDDWVQGVGIPAGQAAQQGQGPGVLPRLQEFSPGTHMRCILSKSSTAVLWQVGNEQLAPAFVYDLVYIHEPRLS